MQPSDDFLKLLVVFLVGGKVGDFCLMPFLYEWINIFYSIVGFSSIFVINEDHPFLQLIKILGFIGCKTFDDINDIVGAISDNCFAFVLLFGDSTFSAGCFDAGENFIHSIKFSFECFWCILCSTQRKVKNALCWGGVVGTCSKNLIHHVWGIDG
jgi:hypothetical protein